MYRSLNSSPVLALKIAEELCKSPQFILGKSFIQRVANEVLIENRHGEFNEDPPERSPFDEANDREDAEAIYEELMDDMSTVWALNRLRTLATTGNHYDQVLACQMIVQVNILLKENGQEL